MRVRLNAPNCAECLYECCSIFIDGGEYLILKLAEEPGHFITVACRSAAEAQSLFEEAFEQGFVDLRGFQYS